MMSLRFSRLPSILTFAALCLCGAEHSFAQRRDPVRDQPAVRAAFRESVVSVRKAVARIDCQEREVALGAVVGPDGWIVTKASELVGPATCRIGDKTYSAKLAGVHEEFDLALLKIDAKDLAVIEWAKDHVYRPGQWVVTAGLGDEPVAVGVVSVAPRAIPPSSMLGVSLADAEDGPQIMQIVPDSGAEKAGLQVSDIITHADGQRTASRQELISHVRKLNVGKTVKLKVKRGDKELEITATLGKGEVHFQDRLGGGLSERAAGFPLALQHDTLLRPRQCGGPLVDLDGHVVGINIARAGRVNSYAIPAKSVQELLPDLMAGKFAPPPSATTDVKKEGEKTPEKTGG